MPWAVRGSEIVSLIAELFGFATLVKSHEQSRPLLILVLGSKTFLRYPVGEAALCFLDAGAFERQTELWPVVNSKQPARSCLGDRSFEVTWNQGIIEIAFIVVPILVIGWLLHGERQHGGNS